MNEIPFNEVEEVDDFHRVRLAVKNGWMILDIYKRKRQVDFSNGEFEEYPVYIIANPQGG